MLITHLPLDTIDATALPRDRGTLDKAALLELQTSIALTGLRLPIEVFELADLPEGSIAPHRYALISGLRRLTAVRTLRDLRGNGDFTTIAAVIRTPASIPAALAEMVAENEVRAAPSPWDRGRILVELVHQGHFPTIDAAVEGLHPTASRQKRARLRACAGVVEDLDSLLTSPEDLTENRLLRLASALRGGFVELIQHILTEVRGKSLATQWEALLPTLIEADRGEEETPATYFTPARPRRMLGLKQGLVIRREYDSLGYSLRFSGPEAKRKGLMDDVIDQIEFWFGQ